MQIIKDLMKCLKEHKGGYKMRTKALTERELNKLVYRLAETSIFVEQEKYIRKLLKPFKIRKKLK